MTKYLFLFLIIPLAGLTQVAKDYAVLVTADVQVSPPKITLHWPASSAASYFVYKKLKSQTNFGSAFQILAGTATSYEDTSVSVGESYEYQVKQNASVAAYGYINCGIQTDADESGLAVKGKLILLVDSALAQSLTVELENLTGDMEGEGWTVIRFDIPSSMSVPDVKQIISSEYLKDPANVKSLFLLGHVPVPYSGNLAPDAHPDHVGAWPADCYYAEMNSNWTDNIINTTSAPDPRNQNIPGDGKFDYSTLPSDVELQIGRVDFYDMPVFAASEINLTKKYLNKNHAFRTKQIQVTHRALIDDNFGGFSGEAFAASAYKSFTTFFGPDSLYSNIGTSLDYRTDLNSKPYLWSYGCGGGSYTSAGGIGTTTQLATDSLQTVFTSLFGSYFGDWDKTNNFLRAPLAQGLTLTNAWSGRPHWYFHHMGLGENIGYSQKITANNSSAYYMHYAGRFISIALMGDPTLRMFVVTPPSALQLSETGNAVNLSWTASAETVLGYHVYRKDSLKGIYHKVNESLITGTNFTDTEFESNGEFFYSVRAVKLEQTSSGSYYNLSTGAIGEITTLYTGRKELSQGIEMKIYPNPNNGTFVLETQNYTGALTLKFSDVGGRLLYQDQLLMNESVSRKTLHFGVLTKGLYFLEISGQGKSKTEKILIR